MKKRARNVSIQFWVYSSEKEKMLKNMKRNGMENLSDFLRALGTSNAKFSLGLTIPNVLQVESMRLETTEESEGMKRAAG